MYLSARHAGDHHRRAGHVNLLRAHAILSKKSFFLRDPKRTDPRADIRITDDNVRRREEKRRHTDSAKHESHCSVEFLHHRQPRTICRTEKITDDWFITPCDQWRR